MRILWCTVNREHRASRCFKDLLSTVSNLVEVTTLVRNIGSKSTAEAKKEVLTGNVSLPQLVTKAIEEAKTPFDFIVIDAVVLYHSEPWNEIKIPKALIVGDVHKSIVTTFQFDHINKFGINVVFHTYRDSFYQLRPNIPKIAKCIWLPPAVDTQLFRPYTGAKTKQVLMIGRYHKRVYPVRLTAVNALKRYPFFTIVERPDDKDPNGWPRGIDYAKVLSSAEITITDSSCFHYPVEKYFEIPACGSLLLATWEPEMKQLGFVPDKNMVIIDAHPSKMVTQVQNLLAAKDVVVEITKQGTNLIKEYHSMDTRAKQFINSLCEYTNKPLLFTIDHDYMNDF